MKATDSFFSIFLCILFFYFWRNIEFWMLMTTYKTQEHDILIFMSLGLIWLFSFYYILTYKNLITNSLIHLLSLGWFVGILIVLIYNADPFSAYLKCLLWPLLFETTYICTILYRNNESPFKILFIALAALGGLFFLISMLYKGFEGASNMVYFIILTVPFLLALRAGKNNFFILIATTAFALLSLKRSMMFALAMFWVVHYLYAAIKKKQKIQSLFLIVFLSIAAFYSYNFVDRLSGSNISKRMEKEDITNGREAIYEITIQMISNSTLDHKILGNGQNAVRNDSILDLSAHNEWLEILYDYGYIVFSLYVLLWVYMIRTWIKLYKTKSRYLDAYTLCLSIWLVMSIVSQLIMYVSYVLYLFMFLAYIEAKTQKVNIKNHYRLRLRTRR